MNEHKRRLPLLLVLVCAMGLLVTALDAHAREFSFDLTRETMQTSDASANVVTKDRAPGGLLVRVGMELVPQTAIDFQWWTNTENFVTMGEYMTVSRNAFMLGARHIWPVLPWFEPYARASGGVLRSDYSLGNSTDYHGTTISPGVAAALGFDVLTPRGLWSAKHFAFGVNFDIGYQHFFKTTVGLTANDDGESIRAPINLGDLTLTGLTARIGFALRF